MRKETKAAPRPETRAESETLARAFEAYKEANDARLAAIERGRADVLLDDKVDRIDRALTEQKALIERLALAGRRPPLAADPRVSEHKSAWNAYLRRGDEAALARIETKELSVADDGAYIAPPELDRIIESRLKAVSPMRSIATVRTTGANVFKKPISTTAAGTGWAAETGARAQTTPPTLALIEFPTAELYANLAATQTLLDDAYVNLEEWIAGEVEEAFAGQERTAFVTGDGVNKPKGFLSYTNVADSGQDWEEVGYIASGAAGAFAATNPVDKLIDLVYAPKAQFRQNGRFVMNRKTVSAVRKLKDADDHYIWQPSDHGAGSTLLGYPITEIEEMPNIATDAFAIAFGDFARFYLIVDRAGVRVLRDPFTAKPYVLFYVTKRVGGGIQNYDAVKLMKFAAS
ncbi:MAG: phage major capsid protein [Hydrogenophilaceae bacterium]|nr:phage major capsid protein [Hydrogenophilaceae bacterium]